MQHTAVGYKAIQSSCATCVVLRDVTMNSDYFIVILMLMYTCHTYREGITDQTEISDLTWEQKEQVLRLLFSKMNRRAPPTTASQPLPLPPIATQDSTLTELVGGTATTGDGSLSPVFITQNTTGNVVVGGQVT